MAVDGGHHEPLNEVDYAHLAEIGGVAGGESSTAGLGGSRICFLRLIASAAVIGVIVTAVIVAASLQGNVPTPPSQPPYNPVVRLGCTHPVFCTGPLLKAVQVTNLFPDAKTFVDMPIINIDSPLALVQKFLEVQDSMLLPSSTPDSPVYNSSLLRAFVDQYFAAAGSDLMTAIPADWKPSPPLLSNNNTIKDDDLRAFALDVNDAWKVLVRKYNNRNQYCEGCLSSLPLPHSFVVPGGRFREFYYWDTYWILNGLLLSGMQDTARDTLNNFLSMVDTYGFIPNGARMYFLDRSQPPLLAEMVALYYNITGDASMVVEAMPRLLAEHRFWMETDHLINISTDFSESAKNRFQGRADVLKNALLNRYYANTTEPRPESWREDMATSAEAPNRAPSDLFSNLAAGAETGWDYSSRWLDNTNNTFYPPNEGTNPLNNPNYNNLSTILTRHLVPVDLNTILLRSEEIIASFLYGNWKDQTQLEQSLFTELNGVVFDATLAAAAPSLADRDVCAMMATYAQRRRHAIQNILYVDKIGAYSDFNMMSGMYTSESNPGSPLSPPFYASSMLPFSVNTIARFGLSDEQVTRFLNDLTGFVDIGGVPASNVSVNTTSGNPQQWDYPNGWAPLQYWAVDALEMIAATDRPQSIALQADALRKKIVQAWITNNYCGYQTPQTLPNGDVVHSLVEKYAVNQDKGVSGHGGEYTVQVGFGWTNGVALNFIAKNGDWLTTGVC